MKLAQNLEQINSAAKLSNSVSDVGDFSKNVLPYVYYGAAILLLVYMISGGFQIMFGRGDPKALQAGWGKISSAVIGFLIVLFAYTLTTLIGHMLGVGKFSEVFNLPIGR